MTDAQKLNVVLTHIQHVRENCEILGRKLIEQGNPQLGRALIARGLIHDNSKLSGIEWEFLDPETADKAALKYAIVYHQSINPHHPEYWNGIQNMPELYLAEMCADWKARSTEFANNLREWIDNKATKKYGFAKEDVIYTCIMRYINMLCDKPFEEYEEEAKKQA